MTKPQGWETDADARDVATWSPTWSRFDVSDAESDFASLAEIAFMAGGRYGIESRPWKRPELFGAGYNGLDLFGLEAGIEAWWSVVNRTPTGWDRELDGAPVGMRADDPRWDQPKVAGAITANGPEPSPETPAGWGVTWV